jgi:predicted nucleic acid-binding protein
MKKLKIYLDTSAVSHLDAPDAPDKTQETLALWDTIITGAFDVFVSDVTIEELEHCEEPKKSRLYEFLGNIDITRIEETEESITLTNKYIGYGVLKEKSRDDCRHIALATVNDCDYIISWNFKHFVNIKTIDKVQAVNKLLGYREIKIVPPPMLLGGE